MNDRPIIKHMHMHTHTHAHTRYYSELFYQVSLDDEDNDDSPIIKHSPLVEEQLAGEGGNAALPSFRVWRGFCVGG